MKILTLLNYLQKLPRTAKLFIRTGYYGLNEVSEIRPVTVKRVMLNEHQRKLLNYGMYDYATDWEVKKGESLEGFELIFKDKEKTNE